MTPDRARSILVEYVRVDSEKGDSTPLQRMAVVVQAILAACAEAEREARHRALTEAINTQRDSSEDDVYQRIVALRDREPR